MSARSQEQCPYMAPQVRAVRLRFPNWTRFSTPRRRSEPAWACPSYHQWLALHRPTEWLGHRGIEIGDEALDPLLKMLLGGEVAAAEQLADQDRKPDLDLVHPRCVLGREVERDPMIGIAQERLTCCHRLKDAGLAFLPEVVGDAAELCDQAGHAFGHVRVEIVADHVPPRRRRRGGEQRLQKRDEIRFG